MKSTLLAVAAVLALFASQAAFALRCGDFLYHSVTLSGDVICAPDEYGLLIGADGVRVDLNGFTLYGSTASIAATAGIQSVNHSGTEIVGPGRIQDFLLGISLSDGGKHRVSGVTVVNGGVFLINVGDSVVERSQMPHLSIGTRSGGMAYYNQVVDNDFFPAAVSNPIQANTAILVSGCGAERNVITGNRMAAPPPMAAPGFGLMIFVGANNNLVKGNTFSRSVFVGHGVHSNVITRNVITAGAGFAGVELSAGYASCIGGFVGASDNVVLENEISGGPYGVAVRSLPGALSTGNQIRGNVISGQYAGLAFSTGSNNNDGRQNRVQAPVYAIDYGAGNLWP